MKFVFVCSDYPDPSDDFDAEDHASFAESRSAWTTLDKAKAAVVKDIRSDIAECLTDDPESSEDLKNWEPSWEIFARDGKRTTSWKIENPADGFSCVVRRIPLR